MKAVWLKEFGGSENLEIREVEDLPKPNEKEVLVKVFAFALNRADLLQRKGLYLPPIGVSERILGLEFAGEVAEIGNKVTKFKKGERVFGIVAGGSYAEFVSTTEDEIVKIPKNLNYPQAAACPEAFITAHDALFTQGNLQNGEVLLIHAVGSGVGLAGLQLAKNRNCRVIGTSRSLQKLEKCRKFGLDEGLLIGEKNEFAEAIKGVDIILDLVGAKYFQENLNSLKNKGRLILVGLTGGIKTEINLGQVLAKRLRITGTVLRSRSRQEKAEATKLFAEEVVPLLESGKIVPNLDRTFKLEEIADAHQYLESNQSFGKLVVEF